MRGGPPSRLLGLGLVLACACAAVAAPARAQAPDADWRAFETPHFRVTFEAGLEPAARHAAAVAEGAYALYARTLTPPPAGAIELVVSDHADYSNGSATPLPSNRITILVKPPVDNPQLDDHRDWIELVVVHELAHVFHIDQAGTLGRVVRGIFGRLPLGHPAFPALFTPGWAIEGLATELESRHTGAGRVRGTYLEMVLRTAALRDRLAPIDRASHASPVWPEGLHAYAYGGLFLDHLSDTLGEDAAAALVRETARATLSPTWFFDRVGRRAFGEEFTALWAAWLAELRADADAIAARAAAAGGEEAERITRHGRYAAYPRVSPDGSRLLYSASTGRDDPATRVLALPDGHELRRVRRSQDGFDLGPAAWLPDGSGFVFSQFELVGPYRAYEDLYVWRADVGTTRLTEGARLTEPDVAPDGRRVVAVRNGGGATALVVLDLREPRPDTLAASPGVDWATPRWSRDGRRIAVARREDGVQDIVVLDARGAALWRVTDDRAVDRVPAWSPDGRWLLFASDRSGVPQIYAVAAGGGPAEPTGAVSASARGALRQVTHVATGAFDPEVAPDGRTLFFVEYDADGFHVQRAPFEPDRWTMPAALDARFREVERPPRLDAGLAARGATSPVSDYSALPSLRPYAWIPVLETGGVRGTAVGAATFGSDVIGRHDYAAAASWAPGTGRTEWALDYDWAGLGNPLLSGRIERDWDLDARVLIQPDPGVPGTRADVVSRTDEFGVDATLLRRRWRSTAALSLGGSRITGRRTVDGAPGFTLAPELRPIDRWTARAVATYSNARGFVRSVSREAGVTALAGVERAWDAAGAGQTFAEAFTELHARAATYQDVRVFGFADHVLAGRVAGVLRTGVSAPLSSAGGAPGAVLDLGLASLGSRRFLHARGYASGTRAGTRGWSASLEYRLPLELVARGHGLLPVFLQSASGAVFVDVADAWCRPAQIERGRCAPEDARDERPLIGAGVELRADVVAYFNAAFRLRAGLGLPLTQPRDGPRAYVAFGPAF